MTPKTDDEIYELYLEWMNMKDFVTEADRSYLQTTLSYQQFALGVRVDELRETIHVDIRRSLKSVFGFIRRADHP